MTYRVTKVPQIGGPGVISYGHTNKENNHGTFTTR
jgi:hypothetical protein